ncbi:MAG: TIM barrel protein [Candidatus Hydrogenedens sp.]|nr:TIM barrel protein [Candidatus Hydrogenedens sp.]
MKRRDFIKAGLAATAAATLAPRIVRAEVPQYGGFRMGAQSYCFRQFDYKGTLEGLQKLGLKNVEFCSVHFPPAKGSDVFEQVKADIAASGITPVSFGVEGFTKDDESSRVKFDFAKALGLEVLTANPMRNAFESLGTLCDEYDIKIAIHNHGPGALYDKVQDTAKAVEGLTPRIGACVDTGHVIRSGEKPHEVIRELGDRVISLHLKDWIHDGEEQILGEGDIDLKEVAKALRDIKFTGPVMLEFELFPEDPVPGMAKGLENWDAACKEALA